MLADLPQGLNHASLDLNQPLLYSAIGIVGLDLGLVRDDLALNGDHASDVIVGLKPELVDALKALLEVRLDASWVLGLGEDLEHLIVGEEKEAREGDTLDLQVCSKTLLDVLE